MSIVKAKRDENGKVVVKLYGEYKDVTAIVKNGVATAKFFGKQYDIAVDGEVPHRPSRQKQQPDENEMELAAESEAEGQE